MIAFAAAQTKTFLSDFPRLFLLPKENAFITEKNFIPRFICQQEMVLLLHPFSKVTSTYLLPFNSKTYK